MSGTLNQLPSQSVYDDWQVKTYQALGEKADANARANSNSFNNLKVARDQPLPDVQFNGKPAPESWIGKKLAGRLFGSPDARKGNTLEEINGKDVCLHDVNSKQIWAMWGAGTAAPVRIKGENGRGLNGSFFSADGYNLKDNGDKVDTSRPVVLLLTGSGGSAEAQGFDVAQFYAKNGASVLSVNYAGFGGSDQPPGTPSELSQQQDAQSMLQHLINLGYDPDKIIIHGYSMGAAVAAELQRANEAPRDDGQAPPKFRGAVQDRPMLSAVHGVEGHYTAALHPFAAKTRNEVGGFQGERAIMQMDPTMPMVITSDKGLFAKRADELRKKLQRNHQNVSGEHSGGGHFDHAKMLAANGTALVGLIQTGRDGAPDLAGAPQQPDEMPYEKLVELSKQAIAEIQQGVTEAAARLSALAPNARNAVDTLRGEILGLIGDLVDVQNFLPRNCPEIAQLQPAIQSAMNELERLAVAVRAKATTDLIKPSLRQEEVDLVATHAADVLDCLQKAGGPTTASDELKAEILKVWQVMKGVGISRQILQRMQGDLEELFDAFLNAVRDTNPGHYV
ncbi:MAG: alpha/beta fold hydrolase [Acetobacteraceae bacterium]|jgi:dienelactone hydrolase